MEKIGLQVVMGAKLLSEEVRAEVPQSFHLVQQDSLVWRRARPREEILHQGAEDLALQEAQIDRVDRLLDRGCGLNQMALENRLRLMRIVDSV